jgi:hypothetical protein
VRRRATRSLNSIDTFANAGIDPVAPYENADNATAAGLIHHQPPGTLSGPRLTHFVCHAVHAVSRDGSRQDDTLRCKRNGHR